MKATPYSNEPYYPMILSNGQDGIVVNYTGTNVCPSSGHGFPGETLGVPCGWYKASSRAANGKTVQQILRAGIEVEIYDSSCMPKYYEQSMDAKEGILTTKMIFADDVHITVESFLTENGLWGEKVTVTECPENIKVQLGFSLLRTFSGYAWTELLEPPTMEADPKPDEVSFTYSVSGKPGMGALWPSEPFVSIESCKDYFYGTMGKVKGLFGAVKKGTTVSRLLACVDATECEDYVAEYENRKQMAAKGYEYVKALHVEQYKKRNADTWVQMPDERLQGVYDISRYHLDGNFNRKTGAISLGLLPHLWDGGLHCSYDATFIIAALMRAGNEECAKKYSEFFISQGKMGKKALEGIGEKGTGFTGWTNSEGGFARLNKDLAYWLISDKPMFHLCEILNRYIVWKYTDRKLDRETEEVLRDAVLFVEKRLLRKIDGRHHMIEVQSGTENDVRVEADTSTIVQLAAAFRGAAEMLEEPRLRKIADEVLLDLAGNYREDGTLMPYRNAPYTAGGQMDYYLYTLPEPIDIVSVDNALRAGKTPWGYTFEQTTEEKRHWPWIHPRAAICYANEKRSEDAMMHLCSIPNYASSMGAIPEYIRIDGLPVNYWYTTAHGLAVCAVHDAFAHVRKEELRLLWGMTNAWQEFSCKKLHLENGLCVSISVKDGVLCKLELYNKTDEDKTVTLSVNHAFCPAHFPKSCTVRAKEAFIFEV